MRISPARILTAVLLVVAAVVWIRVNGRWEIGGVLVVIDPAHGLTVADLPAIAAVILAVVLVWPRRGSRTRREPTRPPS